MRRLDQVILYVSDLQASIAFYRDVLELPFRFSEHGYAEFLMENAKLGLYERGRARELTRREPPPGGAAEVLFVVEDADRWAGRLRDAGAEVLAGPEDHPWGHRTVHVADPDGHVVELAQEIPRERPRGEVPRGGV
jgi:lactoylglutathione lyase